MEPNVSNNDGSKQFDFKRVRVGASLLYIPNNSRGLRFMLSWIVSFCLVILIGYVVNLLKLTPDNVALFLVVSINAALTLRFMRAVHLRSQPSSS